MSGWSAAGEDSGGDTSSEHDQTRSARSRSRSGNAGQRVLRHIRLGQFGPNVAVDYPTPAPGTERFIGPCFQALDPFRRQHALIAQASPLRVLSSCGGTLGELKMFQSMGVETVYETSENW